MDWELGVSTHKLLYIEWISNKVLLHSTWLLKINVSRENNLKKSIYIHRNKFITESLCCTPATNMML